MQSLAIVGVGLIGGSLGLAVRKAGFRGEILGVSSARSVAEGIRRGAIDRGASLEEAAQADVVYLAQPISGILSTIDKLAGSAGANTLVTDAGSTKSEIVRHGELKIGPHRFLGGHPMAGKSSRGVEEAEADLFQDRTYVLTPTRPGQLETPAAGEFTQWLERCGARLQTVSPEEHDTIVAWTSHLPQVLSTVLGGALAGMPDRDLAISGPGLMDMTRLALSSYDVWKDILATNRAPIEHALHVYIDKLTELRDNLQTQRLGEDFRIAADMASRLRR